MDTDTFTKALADVAKVALRDAGVTQRDAASLTGIPLTTLSRRLTGNSPFSSTELNRIASVTGTTVSRMVLAAENSQDAA